jgi:hypothetical protein
VYSNPHISSCNISDITSADDDNYIAAAMRADECVSVRLGSLNTGTTNLK